MEIVGQYHALWVLMPVDSVIIDEVLNELGLELQQKDLIAGKDGETFLWWEFGIQRDCGPTWSSWFRKTFHEAKCSIPFVFSSTKNKLLSLKRLVLLDDYVNCLGSRFLHSLDTPYASVTFNDSEYIIKMNKKITRLDYKSDHEYKPWKEIEGIDLVYSRMLELPWAGSQVKNENSLSFSSSVFHTDTMKARPINGNLDIESNMFPFLPGTHQQEITAISSENPYGAVEIKGSFTISCSN